MTHDLTKGSIIKTMIWFSIPYLISVFLQTFYGLADLFIVGQFNKEDVITAVSMGSQIMHVIVLIIAGLSVGTTVSISRSLGEGNKEKIPVYIGNSTILFVAVAVILTPLLILLSDPILTIMQTPIEAYQPSRDYITICFAGLPFVAVYNLISSIFRGLGDTKSPMIFVAISGVVNILLDYIFVGPMGMHAAGAALATVLAQAMSVVISIIFLARNNKELGVRRSSFRFNRESFSQLLHIGAPLAFQEMLVEISFLFITAIANSRGVFVAAAVGVTEKSMSFFFLVPIALQATIAPMVAQNAGAGLHERGRKILRYGVIFVVVYGLIIALITQFTASGMIGMFTSSEEVIVLGTQYLRVYIFDTAIASIHFCISGYFNAYEKSIYVFIHNIISTFAVRVPAAYLASLWFPETLYQMGLAAPLGSVASVIICSFMYFKLSKTIKKMENITTLNCPQ